MDRWTVEMVEDRLVEAAVVMRRLPSVRMPGYFNTSPKMVVEFADRVGQQPEPMQLAATVTRGDQSDVGGAHVAALAGSRGCQAGLGAVGSYAVEGGPLAVWHHPGDGASAMAVWPERDRVAAQWAEGASEAVAQFFR